MRRPRLSEQTLASMVRYWAECQPDAVAVVDGSSRLTYEELDDLSWRTASGLREAGVERGEVLSVQLPNCSEFVVFAVAAAYAGLVFNPISHRFRRQELEHIFASVGTGAFVHAGRHKGFDFRDHAALFGEFNPDGAVVVVGEREEGEVDFTMLSASQPIDLEPIDLHEESTILHSSGTEGKPKLPVHEEASMMHCTRAVAERFNLGRSDRFLAAVPLTTGTGTHGMIHCALVLGASLVIMDEWDASKAARLIERERCTYTIGPTTMLFDLLNSDDVDVEQFQSLRLFTCGGAPIPSSLVEEARSRFGFSISPMYGSTEVLAVTTVHLDDPLPRISGSDGCPLFDVEMELVDAVDGIGEIAVAGPTLFVRYAGQPELTSRRLSNGWFQTGDLGSINDDGYVRVVDRLSDVIVRGGVNISSKDVESDLLGHPDIIEAAVVAMPDPRLGERIAAFIVSDRKGAEPGLDEILRHLEAAGVARYRWPEYVVVVGQLPRNASGKVDKSTLRTRLSESEGPDAS